MIAALRNRSVNWRIFTDSVWVAGLLSLVKIAGAAKVVLIARVFGASDALDAFLVAFLIPSFFAEVVAGSLTPALVPALVEAREGQGRRALQRLVSSIASSSLLVLAAVAALLAAGSPFVLQVLGSGFSDEKRALAQSLSYWLLALLPMSGLSIVWRAALNAEERFTVAALAPGATPILILVVLLCFGSSVTVWVLVWTTLTGTALELLLLAIALRRRGVDLLPRWRGWDPALRVVTMQHLPLIAAAAVGNGNQLVDQSMAAMLGSGSVSLLNYGTRLAAVLCGIAGGALSTVAQPQISRMIASDDWLGLKRTLRTYIRLATVFGIPATLLLIAASAPFVRLLFVHGAFTTESAHIVTSVQQLSLLQLPIAVIVALLLRVLSSLKATPLLMRVALGSLVLNTVGDYVLMQWMGLRGIALTSAGVQLFSLFYLLQIVRSRISSRGSC